MSINLSHKTIILNLHFHFYSVDGNLHEESYVYQIVSAFDRMISIEGKSSDNGYIIGTTLTI